MGLFPKAHIMARDLLIIRPAMVLVATAVLFLVTATQSKANTSSADSKHRAQITEMLELMGVPTQVERSASEVVRLYLVKVDEAKASQEVIELVGDYRAAITELVDENLRWDAVKEYYVDAYVENLSAKDAKKVTKFIKSSAGKNFINSQAQATATIQAITRERIDARLTKPAEKLSKDLREALNAISNKSK